MSLNWLFGKREERYQQLLESLASGEQRWAQYQPWLESLGYQLRRRYRPDWTPSWRGKWRSSSRSEDAILPHVESFQPSMPSAERII